MKTIYIPPFTITFDILKKSQEISHELGILAGEKLDNTPIKLRKINKIKTIQASLAIEGNTLSIEQITNVLEGRRVIGPQKDIIEVQNAIEVYKDLSALNPFSIDELLKAHKELMQGLIDSPGVWRKEQVGIFKEGNIKHMPPSVKQIPRLMNDLFEFLKKDRETPWLIKACVFHYELEFIHPFMDGNGRMGRLWQQLILMQEDPIFSFISVEEFIRDNQEKYYNALGECDQAGNSTKFIEFSLEQILKTLRSYRIDTPLNIKDANSRLEYACLKLERNWFSRKDYILIHKNISSATASRDLGHGIKKDRLTRKGENNQVVYQFK